MRLSTAGTAVRTTPVRIAVATVLAVVAALALSGCGAGLGANTADPYNPTIGTDAVIGSMHVDNVVVVDDGNVPELQVVLINQSNEPDTLQSIQVTGVTHVSVPQAGVEVPPTGFVTFGPGAQQRAILDNMQAGLGQLVVVTFAFRVAGTVSVSAMVTTPANLIAGS